MNIFKAFFNLFKAKTPVENDLNSDYRKFRASAIGSQSTYVGAKRVDDLPAAPRDWKNYRLAEESRQRLELLREEERQRKQNEDNSAQMLTTGLIVGAVLGASSETKAHAHDASPAASSSYELPKTEHVAVTPTVETETTPSYSHSHDSSSSYSSGDPGGFSSGDAGSSSFSSGD